MVIYEAPLKSLSLHKMLILSTLISSIMLFVTYLLKPKLGYFSIPVALIISIIVVGKLKTILWATTQRNSFFTEFSKKLELVPLGRYGFIGFLVGITYIAYGKYSFNFYYAFAVAFFMAMMFEELYYLVRLYEQKINIRNIVIIAVWSTICAIGSAIIVMIMMKHFGYSGQVSTITSVILLKLIQPLAVHTLVLNSKMQLNCQ